MNYTSLDKGDHELLSCDRCCVGESFPENETTGRKVRETRKRSMKPRITVITLGVSDLEKSLLFW
jgi:hypothetical protein